MATNQKTKKQSSLRAKKNILTFDVKAPDDLELISDDFLKIANISEENAIGSHIVIPTTLTKSAPASEFPQGFFSLKISGSEGGILAGRIDKYEIYHNFFLIQMAKRKLIGDIVEKVKTTEGTEYIIKLVITSDTKQSADTKARIRRDYTKALVEYFKSISNKEVWEMCSTDAFLPKISDDTHTSFVKKLILSK